MEICNTTETESAQKTVKLLGRRAATGERERRGGGILTVFLLEGVVGHVESGDAVSRRAAGYPDDRVLVGLVSGAAGEMVSCSS